MRSVGTLLLIRVFAAYSCIAMGERQRILKANGVLHILRNTPDLVGSSCFVSALMSSSHFYTTANLFIPDCPQ